MSWLEVVPLSVLRKNPSVSVCRTKSDTMVEVSLAISILYGGSCNAQNAKELFACEDVDGGLIGGASLKAADFVAIANSVAN